MTLYTCEFPLPPTRCSPNYHPASRGAHLGKVRATKAYRDECCLQAKAAISDGVLPKGVNVATIHVSFFCGPAPSCIVRDGRFRPLDKDNAIASFKAGIDGLRDAGVLVADDHRHLSIGRVELYRRKEEHRGRCCVEVTLEVEE